MSDNISKRNENPSSALPFLQKFCGLKYVNFHFLGPKMAFVRKVGSMLKQTISNHVKLELATSKPSIYQAVRCMSSSKVFVGGT